MDLEAIRMGRRRPIWRVFRGLVCLAATTLFAQPPLPHEGKPTEYEVKAAYLFNFAKFTRYPSSTEFPHHSNFDFCVLGRNDFNGRLEALTANEQLNGLPERATKVSSGVAARSCGIVFISESESARVQQILNELAGAPVLTVSDMPHFLEHGGMIGFQTTSSHVRFAVNLDAVTRANLSLSSELLKVAVRVKGMPKRGAQ